MSNLQINSSSLFAVLALIAVQLLAGCSSDSSDSAQLRILNISTGYQSLDVFTNDDDDEDDEDARILSGVAFGTVSSYAEVDAATYSIKFRRAGASNTLYSSIGQALANDSHATYITFGAAGEFQVAKIGDDQAIAAVNTSKLTIVDAASAGSLDVYLTEASIPLDDASPVSSSIIASGTYRMRITAAGNKVDLRLDVPAVTFASTAVVTLVLTPTPGGVLVNALTLPQQGSVTEYLNTKARVRAAVGMANGTTATIRAGSATLLNNSIVGTISGDYVQVDAGSVPVQVSVDGSALPGSSRTLNAGADYTLLVWSDVTGAQTGLISDDNHPPAVGYVRIRVLNGMSALGGPISFSADYSPLADGVTVGQASTYSELLGGADFQLDITNTLTATIVFSRSGVTLQSRGVYTLFMTGGGSASVAGTLRRDR